MRNIIYILVLTFSANSFSQSSKIELINSDRLISGPKNSDYWICIGNVTFKHNETIMYCDSSHHYMKDNRMIAFGKVHIQKGDSLNVVGQELRYNGNKNIAHLKGNVMLQDKHSQLRTSEIKFNLKDHIVYYPNKGTIVEKQTTLTSNKGKYNTKSHLFQFKDNVIVKSKTYKVETDTLNYNSKTKTTYFLGPSYIFSEQNTIYCENGWYNTQTHLSQFRENAYISDGQHLIKGDSLFYDRNAGYGKAINNISMIDTSNNILVNGDLSEYFEDQKKIEVTENALLNIMFEDDTLFISADKFVSFNNHQKEYLIAYENINIFKSDIQGRCDSLYYNSSESVLNLYINPVLWINKIQITSDSINISINKKEIENINFRTNPIIISEADSIYFDQIKGVFMHAILQQNKLSQLNVIGQSQSLFLIKDDKDNSNIGINKVTSDDITIYMKENEINNITYRGSPISVTIPIQDISNEDKYLEGFIWRKEERPIDRNDITQ